MLPQVVIEEFYQASIRLTFLIPPVLFVLDTTFPRRTKMEKERKKVVRKILRPTH